MTAASFADMLGHLAECEATARDLGVDTSRIVRMDLSVVDENGRKARFDCDLIEDGEE